MTHEIPSGSVAAGNPCRVLKTYDSYIAANREALAQLPCFNEDYLIGAITEGRKKEMLDKLDGSSGFIV